MKFRSNNSKDTADSAATTNHIWSIILPVIASILVIATLPPFNLWPIGFFSIAPIYLFLKINLKASSARILLGGFIFSFIFSAFLMAQTILQFHWIEEAYLFSTLVKISFIPLLILISLLSSINFLILRYILRKNEILNILFISLVWTFSEWIIRMCMFKIEYSILGYPAHNSFFITLAGISSIGNIFLVVFFLALINTAIGSILFEFFEVYKAHKLHNKFKKISMTEARVLLAPLSIIVVAFSIGYYANAYQTNHLLKQVKESRTLKIATIQDQDRIGETFGKETNGVFHFKTLEGLLLTARSENPDIIIYPFAPWNGVIYDKEQDSVQASTFNKDVFAVSFRAFGKWQKEHVASSTVFVTWATTYRDKEFYNEITYWKDGQLLGVHQKEHLFPFLDYTPAITQSQGLYTTAVDITPGTTTLQEKINGAQIGALVCSEVTHPISDSTSHDSDIVLSIGSEAFFSSGIAGDLNVANAAYRAAESGKPVIRANRFGPSAFMDQTGKTIAYMPFGVTGVLVDTIQVPILKK